MRHLWNDETTAKASSTWFDYTNQAWVVNGVYQRCGHPENMNCGCYGRVREGEMPAPTIIEQYANLQSQAEPTDSKPSVMTLMSDQDLRNIDQSTTTTEEQREAAQREWQRRHPPVQITEDFALETTLSGEQFAVSYGKLFQITDIVDSVDRANEICSRNSHIGVIGQDDGMISSRGDYAAERSQMKLLLCINCQDVRRIQSERTHCQCGQAWANHDKGSDRNVVANEKALIITLPSSELTSALRRKTNMPTESQGMMTFLCPEPCRSVRRVKEAKQ